MMKHQPDNPSVRVFFALWPKAMERNQLAAWQAPLQNLCGGRSMGAEALHNTLVFVGHVETHRLEVHRFKFDRRDYRPHVTLLRDARWCGAPLPAMPKVSWQIDDFALVQSAHGMYRVLASFPLSPCGG